MATITSFVSAKAKLLSLAQQVAPYLVYKVTTLYHWNEGTLQLPVAETPGGDPYGTPADRPKAEVVRTSAPFGIKIVRVATRRINALPVLPDPKTTNDNETLKHVTLHTESADPTPDMKGRVFTALAEYVYWLKQPIWIPEDGTQLPDTEVNGYDRDVYAYGADQFTTDLIEEPD